MARACKKGTTGRKGQSAPIRSRLWSAEIRDAHLKMWKCENVSQCYALGRILASTNFANSNRRRSRPFFYEAPFLNWGEAHRASAGCRGGASPCKKAQRRHRGARSAMASAMRVLYKIAELAEISEAPFWQCCGKAAPLYPVFLYGVKRPALPWGRGGDASPHKVA